MPSGAILAKLSRTRRCEVGVIGSPDLRVRRDKRQERRATRRSSVLFGLWLGYHCAELEEEEGGDQDSEHHYRNSGSASAIRRRHNPGFDTLVASPQSLGQQVCVIHGI